MDFGGLATLEWDETFRGTEQKERKWSQNKMSQSREERFSTDKVIVHIKREWGRRKMNTRYAKSVTFNLSVDCRIVTYTRYTLFIVQIKKGKKNSTRSPTTHKKALNSSKVKLGTFQIRNYSLDMQQNIQEVIIFLFFFFLNKLNSIHYLCLAQLQFILKKYLKNTETDLNSSITVSSTETLSMQ